MPSTTQFLGQLIGLYAMIIAAAMFVRHRGSLAAINDLLASPALLLVTSVFTILLGLAMVLAHNIWTGPPATLVVTALGWMSLGKGVALLVVPGPR
jgi:hypothetical protein